MSNEPQNEAQSEAPTEASEQTKDRRVRMTPRQWLDNFWYHHKFGTIVGTVALLTIIICATQMCAREQYDLHVMYCGSKSFNESGAESLRNGIAAYADGDLNDDGAINVDLLNIVWLSEFYQDAYQKQGLNVNAAANMNAESQFNAEMQNGQNVICLLDVDLYKKTQENTGIFETWEHLIGETPDDAIDACAIYVSDLPIFSRAGFSDLPETTVLCVRKKGEVNLSMSDEKRAAYYQYHVDCVKAMLENRQTASDD